MSVQSYLCEVVLLVVRADVVVGVVRGGAVQSVVADVGLFVIVRCGNSWWCCWWCCSVVADVGLLVIVLLRVTKGLNVR